MTAEWKIDKVLSITKWNRGFETMKKGYAKKKLFQI